MSTEEVAPISGPAPPSDERLRLDALPNAWKSASLSPRLRALIAVAKQSWERHARHIRDLMESAIPSYAHAKQSDLHADLMKALSFHLGAWYDALLSGESPISQEHIASVAAITRRRVRQGVSMGDLMHAHRLGIREFWNILVETAGDDEELQQELLQKVSLNLMIHIDTHAQIILEVYVAEERQQVRSRDRLRRELSQLLFTRPTDEPGFRELGAALGLDIDAPAAAFAFQLRDARDVMRRVEESLDRIAIEVARALGVSPDSFMRALRGDCLLIWRAAPVDSPGFEYDRKLASQAASVLRATPDLLAAGIGLPGLGPQGWRVAAEQATRALEMQGEKRPTTNEPPLVALYSQVMLVDSATSTENARRFFESIADRLALEPNLLETLRTYFEFKQRRKRVAAELNVHPNTLDYRLARIETLLDLDLDDVSWLARLQVALQWWTRRRGGALVE
jgi:carbohydrate diacid regulator